MRTTSNTFGVVFYLRKYKAKNDQIPIYARITIDGKRVEIATKRSIQAIHWNGNKGMAKGNRPENRALNTYLEQIRGRMVECYQELFLQKKLITAEAVKNRFLGLDQKEYTVSKLMEYHNTYMKDTLAIGTLKNYFTTQKYVNRFMKEWYRTSDMFLSQLSYKFITDLEYYLRNHFQDQPRPLSNNGLMKHIERFRKMINVAVLMEWLEKDPFTRYKQKFEKVEKEFLSQEELTALENKELKIMRLQLVRDLFVFSCYTGLAYIDVMQLTTANITVGIDGEYWIITRRQKTRNPVRVPLLPQALDIIEKYKEYPKSPDKEALFPNISNQRLNSYLKEIADVCGIEKNLTFHLARHTFATTVTLSNGVPIESVSKMLGHTKITTTQIYAKVVERKLSEDMKGLRARLVGNNGNKPAKMG